MPVTVTVLFSRPVLFLFLFLLHFILGLLQCKFLYFCSLFHSFSVFMQAVIICLGLGKMGRMEKMELRVPLGGMVKMEFQELKVSKGLLEQKETR